jgi:hypothetical protein
MAAFFLVCGPVTQKFLARQAPPPGFGWLHNIKGFHATRLLLARYRITGFSSASKSGSSSFS